MLLATGWFTEHALTLHPLLIIMCSPSSMSEAVAITFVVTMISTLIVGTVSSSLIT